jgi:hypothetical protein
VPEKKIIFKENFISLLEDFHGSIALSNDQLNLITRNSIFRNLMIFFIEVILFEDLWGNWKLSGFERAEKQIGSLIDGSLVTKNRNFNFVRICFPDGLPK